MPPKKSKTKSKAKPKPKPKPKAKSKKTKKTKVKTKATDTDVESDTELQETVDNDDDIVEENDSNSDSDNFDDEELEEEEDDDEELEEDEDDDNIDIDDEDEDEVLDETHVLFEEDYNLLLKQEDIGPDDKLNNYRLSVYERTRILGTRAKQISTGASPFVKNVSSLTPIEVATEELNNKLVPIKLIRELPNGITETWNLNEFN